MFFVPNDPLNMLLKSGNYNAIHPVYICTYLYEYGQSMPKTPDSFCNNITS